MEKNIQGSYDDCREIYNSLSEKEQIFMGSRFVNSPYVVFRQVIYDKIPIDFIQLYDIHFGYTEKNEEYHGLDVNIGLAVRPEYRNKGFSNRLLEMAIEWFKQSYYKTMSYIVNNENKSSIKLIEKYKEFERVKNISTEIKEKNERVYIMKQSLKINENGIKEFKLKRAYKKENIYQPSIPNKNWRELDSEFYEEYKNDLESLYKWAVRSEKYAT